jgi:anti-sigma B factor antagonist
MEVQIDKSGPVPIAVLRGEIRSDDGETFLEELHPLVAEPDSRLAIDLSGVDFIDSSGLTFLINVVTRARLAKGRAVLVGPTPFVSGVFEVTNLNQWFEILQTLDDVRHAFRPTP